MKTLQKCMFCGDVIVGRSDKKFCNSNCRNTFNNRTRQDCEKLILETNRILRKNRSILKTLSPVGKSTVLKDYLLKLDFDFKYHTHSFKTNHGNTYKYCYEYGYLEIEDGKKILIVCNTIN